MSADVTSLAPVRHDAGQQVATRRPESNCRLVEWRPRAGDSASSLLGHAAVSFSGGWTVHGIPVFRSADGQMSVGVPQAAQLDADGRVRLKDGKRLYSPVLSFETADARERWRRSVLGALAAGGIGGAP
jgi:hypothetical protein